MKQLLLTVSLTILSIAAGAQCMLYPVAIEERINTSPVIVEGGVIRSLSFWDKTHSNIYTLHEITVTKVFRWNYSGTVKDRVYVVTEGGTVGNIRQQVTSTLDLDFGDVGIFFCQPARAEFNGSELPMAWHRFEAVAGPQGFIDFDETRETASDPFNRYTVNPDLYNTIIDLTGQKPEILKEYAEGVSNTNVAPVINSFSPATVSAGTKTVVTISGSNFGATRGTSTVGFRNADNGGSNFIFPEDVEYVSWSDNEIKVEVTAKAGTGKIQVDNGSGTAQTATDITINFAMLNVVDGSNIVYQPVHINDNNAGGYTWQFFTDFYNNSAARQSFLRAFQNWRCGSFINWNIGVNTSVNTIASDGVNVIRFDIDNELPSGVLGRCSSWWSGCIQSGNTKWYVNELDIVFDDDQNWNYGPGSPAFAQYDFESVAVHELGHGHQLGHVISSGEIMHYSISNGQTKRTLSPLGDLAGGDYVMDLNATGARCSKTAMTALNATNCSLIPVANFGSSATTVCPTVQLSFTDSSGGSTLTYNWDFGTGASPATATGKGPHTVNYTTPGLKTIQLIVGGVAGDDTITKTNFINVLPPKPGIPGTITGTDTGCIRSDIFSIRKVTDATTYIWGLSGGGTNNSSTDTSVNMSFSTAGGPYTIWVKASNSCGTSDSASRQINVVANPDADFTFAIQNDTIKLTNTSTNAYGFVWKFGAGQTSTFDNLDLIPNQSGTYSVTLVASNFCGSDSVTKQIGFVKASVGEVLNKIGMQVYPNPMTDVATIEVKDIAQYNALSFELFDIAGRKVRDMVLTEPTTSLHKDELATGMYLYKATHNGETVAAGRVVVK